MKILFFERTIAPYQGGVQRVTWVVSKYLEKNGHNCFYAYCEDDYDIVRKEFKFLYDKRWSGKKLGKELSNYIQSNDIDIFVNQGYFTIKVAKACSTIKKETSCKVVSCLHLAPNFMDYSNLALRIKIKRLVYNFIVRKDYLLRSFRILYNVSDKIVVLSDRFIKEIATKAQLPNIVKICSIPDPLSFPWNPQKTIGIKKEKIVLLIARLQDDQKNIKGALKIWEEIEKAGYNEWWFYLGGYGYDQDEILSYADKLKFKRFKFLGRVDSPEQFYLNASIFLMTSNMEGFGMTLTEAIQCGCVPVAYDTYSSLHDIIIDKQNGFIVEAKNTFGFVDRVKELMDNPRLREEMAKNAIDSAEKFSIEEIGIKWLKLFNELLQR